MCYWPSHTGSNLQSTWASLSAAELAAGEQSDKPSAEPEDHSQEQAWAVPALEEQPAQNSLRGIKPGMQNEDCGPI